MPRPKTITVRKRKMPHLKGVRFEVDLGEIPLPDGSHKRVRKFFRDRKKADEFAEEQRGKLRAHGVQAVALTAEHGVLFQAARDRLAAASAMIVEAVNFFLAHHKPLRGQIALRDLLDRALLEKEMAGIRKNSLRQFACSCRSFLDGREEQPAHTVTRDELKDWILGRGIAAKTQRTYLGDVRALFAWALQERWLRENPIAGEDGFIQLAAEDEKEIEVFDPEHCRRLLWAALFAVRIERTRAGTGCWAQKDVPGGFREMIGYIAAAMFAGVRPEENRRVANERLDLRERTLVVVGAAAKRVKKKGRLRRVIELERTAVVWLRLWRRWFPDAAPGAEEFHAEVAGAARRGRAAEVAA